MSTATNKRHLSEHEQGSPAWLRAATRHLLLGRDHNMPAQRQILEERLMLSDEAYQELVSRAKGEQMPSKAEPIIRSKREDR